VGNCPQFLFTTIEIALMSPTRERTHGDAMRTHRRQTMTRPRTKTIPGFHIQPMLPISFYLDGAVLDACFTKYPDAGDCVEAQVQIGLIKTSYTLVLSIRQALEADIIERD
jgi:hypothetical protein